MYIALEGIKGSGKSTLLKNILGTDKQGEIALCSSTASVGAKDPLEQLLVKNPKLSEDDAFMERLFLKRAHVHDQRTRHRPFVLGDRSILTAYVTRWQKWNDPNYTIRRINEQYRHIRKPDVYILLESDVDRSLRHIAARKPKSTGKNDEQRDALALAQETYQMLLLEGEYRRKIGQTQVIRLNTDTHIDELSREINTILNYYKQKTV